MFRHLLMRRALHRLTGGFFLILLLVVSAENARRHRSAVPTNAATHWKTRLTAIEIEQRSLKICLGFSDSARMVAIPEFWIQEYTFSPVGGGQRCVWSALCEADGKGYELDFNDITGNLMGLRVQHLENEVGVPTIKTAQNAARMALMYLHQMGLIPPGTQITLQGAPEHQNNRTWLVRWKLSGSPSKESCLILVVISDGNGRLMKVVNESELTIFATFTRENTTTSRSSPTF